MRILKVTTAFCAMALMSACGGSGSTAPVALTDGQRLDALTNSFVATFENYSNTATSSTRTMNNATGTAEFRGQGGVLVNPFYINGTLLSSDVSLIGDATVNVDFDNETIGGSVRNMVGVTNNNIVDGYSGSIRLNNGSLDGNGSALSSGTYSGNLNGNGRSLTLNGDWGGLFVGNNSVRGVGIVGDGSSTLGSYNGTSELVIVAE